MPGPQCPAHTNTRWQRSPSPCSVVTARCGHHSICWITNPLRSGFPVLPTCGATHRTSNPLPCWTAGARGPLPALWLDEPPGLWAFLGEQPLASVAAPRALCPPTLRPESSGELPAITIGRAILRVTRGIREKHSHALFCWASGFWSPSLQHDLVTHPFSNMAKNLPWADAGDTNWNSSRSLFSQGSYPSETPVTCADGPPQPLFLGALAPGHVLMQSSKSDTAPCGGARSKSLCAVCSTQVWQK